MDFRIELVPLLVQDVDRSVDLYGNRRFVHVAAPDGNRWALQQVVRPG